MRFKMIIALVDEDRTETLLDAAREAGATGATVITQARGEGLNRIRGVFGLELRARRDVLLFLVEEHRARGILERLESVGQFDDQPGTGIAFQVDVEDAVGVRHQMLKLSGADFGSSQR